MKAIILMIASSAVWSVQAADAGALWDKHCASCHAKDGSGDTRMGKRVEAKDYRDPKVQEQVKDDNAFKAIKEGLTTNGKERMKPFADKLSDSEIKELIKHLRSLKKAE